MNSISHVKLITCLSCESDSSIYAFFFLITRRPRRSTQAHTLFPYTPLFRSEREGAVLHLHRGMRLAAQLPHRLDHLRSEEHTSELQSRELIPYAVFCLKKKTARSWAARPLIDFAAACVRALASAR